MLLTGTAQLDQEQVTFLRSVWDHRDAYLHFLSPKTMNTMKNIAGLFGGLDVEGRVEGLPDEKITPEKLVKRLPGAGYFQTSPNYELEVKDGLFHIEVLNKSTNTRLVFRSLLTERNRDDLMAVLKDMRLRENLETLVLELPPIEDENKEEDYPDGPAPLKEFQDRPGPKQLYVMEGEELKRLVSIMLHQIKPEHVTDGVLPQLIYGRPVADDPDKSMIFYLNKRVSALKSLRMSDLNLEETLKCFMVRRQVQEHRNLFEMGRLFMLLEAVRFSTVVARDGCSKCTGVRVKPIDMYYSMYRDDIFPKQLKTEVMGSVVAEAFTQKRNQTIYVVSDPLYAEDTFTQFLTIISQLRITNQREFAFKRYEKTKQRLDDILDDSLNMAMETVDEMVEKNTILEAIYDIDFDFASEGARAELTEHKKKFQHYNSTFELDSWAFTSAEAKIIRDIGAENGCDAIDLAFQNIKENEDDWARVQQAKIPEATGPQLRMAPKKNPPNVFTPEEMKLKQQGVQPQNEPPRAPERPKFQMKPEASKKNRR